MYTPLYGSYTYDMYICICIYIYIYVCMWCTLYLILHHFWAHIFPAFELRMAQFFSPASQGSQGSQGPHKGAQRAHIQLNRIAGSARPGAIGKPLTFSKPSLKPIYAWGKFVYLFIYLYIYICINIYIYMHTWSLKNKENQQKVQVRMHQLCIYVYIYICFSEKMGRYLRYHPKSYIYI